MRETIKSVVLSIKHANAESKSVDQAKALTYITHALTQRAHALKLSNELTLHAKALKKKTKTLNIIVENQKNSK